MATGDDGRKSPWSSWLAPGDIRRAGREAPHESLDSDAKRQLSQERHEQTSQLGNHGQYRSAITEDIYNPLIAFKRFVDNQFAAITEFSSNVTELKRASREQDAAYETQRQAPRRWTGSVYRYADFKHMSRLFPEGPEEATDLATMLVREANLRNQHVPSEKIVALFEDRDFNPNHVMEANSPWPFYYMASSEQGQETTPASPTHWLSVDWFKHNPYSPVNLEADTMLSQYDTKWRNAFENLLETSLDKPMTSGDRTGFRPFAAATAISTWRGPGLDWMLSLQCRGILPPQLPSMYAQCRLPTGYSTSPAQRDLGIQAMARADLGQLIYEIAATSAPYRTEIDDSTDEYWEMMLAEKAKLDVDEAQSEPDERICPRHADNQSSEDYAYETSLAERYYRDQLAAYGEADPSPNRCPDELGRAVGKAARRSETGLTELDVYELQVESTQAVERAQACGQEIRNIEEQAARRYRESLRDEGSDVGEPDRQDALQMYQAQLEHLQEENARRLMEARREEGSTIGEVARQQAARAFADEENGLGEDSAFGRQPVRGPGGERIEDLPAAGTTAWAEMCAEQLDEVTEQVMELDEEQYALRRRMDRLVLDQKVLLERLEAREREQAPRVLDQGSHVADQPFPLPLATDSGRPQVLSTLTTTQTTRLPDGSIKTTVVLKRRFADGGEETQESTQTSFDEPSAVGGAVGQEPLQKERKSWFWS
jgi:hypothetical protein